MADSRIRPIAGGRSQSRGILDYMADDPVQSVADLSTEASSSPEVSTKEEAKVDPNVTDPNIIPPAESASSPADRPVSTILADLPSEASAKLGSPTEPKTPLADPGSDYTAPATIPDESTVATESASIAPSPSTVPIESGNQLSADPQIPVQAGLPSQSATVPTEAQRESSTPPPPPSQSPEPTEGGSIQDSSPSDQPSQVQPETPVSAPSSEASQAQEIPPQSAEIKPEPPQDTQEAPLADLDSQKTSFGDILVSTGETPTQAIPPVSPQLPQTPISSPFSQKTSFGDLTDKPPTEEPTINIVPIEAPKETIPPPPISPPLPQSPISPLSPQSQIDKVIEAKAGFSFKRQQALQTRRKKREDHLAKIIALVGQKGKVSNKDVRDALRVSQSTVTNYLHILVNNGKIKKEGKAKATMYSL